MLNHLNPYLVLDGTASKAIALYEKALGAKTEAVMLYKDIPGNTPKPENANRVIHALLHIGNGIIMMSDAPENEPAPGPGNIHVLLDFKDVNDMRAKFEALSAGGKVTGTLQDTFWGATFGTLTDAYGVNWMFNCTKAK